MTLPVVPLDSNNERQHRSVIATATNELVKSRHPYNRTGAESSANIGPRDAAYLPGNILRQGAQSAQNSSTAINETIDQTEIGYGNFGGAATFIPYGRFLANARIEVTATASIYGDGYASTLQLPTGSTHIAVLVQHAAFTEILGVRLRDFRIDANGGGQLDALLVQINNAVGFVADSLWIANGSKASGSSGIGGIGCSVGSLGATGRPQGVITSCFVEAHSKGAYNITTQSTGVAVAFNIARNGAGTNITPAYQINGAQNTRLIGNLSYSHEGRGIIAATDDNDEPPGYTIAAFNICHDFGTGTSASDGNGFAHTNISSTNFGRCLYAYNIFYDGGKGSSSGSHGVTLQNDSRISLSHNYIYDVGLHGINLNGGSNAMEDINVCDNFIENINSKGNSVGACVYVQGTVKKVTISRNRGFNSSGSSAKYFLYIDNAATIEDLVIEDNDIYGMATANYHFGTGGATITRTRLRIHDTFTTTDNSQHTVFSFPVLLGSAMRIKANAVGVNGSTNRAAYEREAVIWNNAGTATIQGGAQTSLFSQESNANYDASISVTGGLVVLLLKGDTGETVKWGWTIEARSIA